MLPTPDAPILVNTVAPASVTGFPVNHFTLLAAVLKTEEKVVNSAVTAVIVEPGGMELKLN